MYTDRQIELLQEFLIQEVPKLVDNEYLNQPLTEKVIESLSQKILKLVRKVFDPTIELRMLYVDQTREYSIFLVDGEKSYQLVKGNL